VADLALHLGQRLPGGVEPVLRDVVLHLQQYDAGIFGSADAPKAGQEIFFAVSQLAVDQHNRLRTMVARVDGLRDQLRMTGKTGVAALVREPAGS